MKQKRILSILLALTLSMSMLSVGAAAPAGATMETLFPDPAFREAVQSTFYQAEDDTFFIPMPTPVDLSALDGQALVDALASYTGVIHARSLGIEWVDGIEYLTKAEEIDLRNNLIEDWRGVFQGEAHYGYTDSSGEDLNVTLNIGGNPFRFLPANFGGWLVVKQAATTSSSYPEDMYSSRIFVRDAATDQLGGTFDIRRCKIGDESTYVDVISAEEKNRNGEENYLHITDHDNTTADFTIYKSGRQVIAVGIDQEIHYKTSDEYGTVTDGEQSFKYYINPLSYVYDRVTLRYEGTGGAVLTKTDENTGAALAGAVYELYQVGDSADVKVGDTYTTDGEGKLEVLDLALGAYYFKELSAPAGYELKRDKIGFTIGAELGGGLTTVTPTTDDIQPAGGNPVKPLDPVNADAHQVFIAGPSGEDGASPDITLTLTGDEAPEKVTVTYTKLGTIASSQDNVVLDYPSLAEAEAAVNAAKNANTIMGPVLIDVVFAPTSAHMVQVSATNQKSEAPPPAPDDPGERPSIPRVSVSGQKIWVDDDNAGNTRPNSIQVALYRDGGKTPYRTASISASHNWSYSFTGLPKYSTGDRLSVYTVAELSVPQGYVSAVSADNATITNTLVPTAEHPPADPAEPGEPNTPPTTDPGEPAEPGKPTQPTTPDDSAKSAAPPSDPNIPQTSDDAPVALLATLSFLFAAAAVFFWRKRGQAGNT